METDKRRFTKQYPPPKDYEQGSLVKCEARLGENCGVPFKVSFGHVVETNRPVMQYHPQTYRPPENEFCNEEPIDLTTFNNKKSRWENAKQESCSKNVCVSTSESSTGPSSSLHPKRRRKRRKFAYTPDGKLVLIPNDETLQSPASFSEAKQLEILKAAKSLFSKRTRTLYHWMYPKAAKPQIKAAVTSSWESLGAQEKDFYISQVLGRFGFPQSSLMVNPQLGGIRELPLAAEADTKSKSRELQSAISSILPEGGAAAADSGGGALTFEEFEEMNELTRKRRGRPPGSSNKKHKYGGGAAAQDFKDDPELSQELEQFATMFNLSKI